MSGSGLVVEKLGLPEVDGGLARTLLKLNSQSPRPCPFFTPEYMTSYLARNEKYPPGTTYPFMLVVRRVRDRAIVGAIPLKRVREFSQGVPFSRIEFLVATEVDLPVLLAAPDDQLPVAEAIMRTLPRLLVGASEVRLLSQPEDSALFRARHAASTLWSTVLDDPGMPISLIAIAYPDVGTYFHALNKKMRSNVSRLARKLSSEGRLEYLTVHDSADTAELLRVYLDVEARSWKRGTDASLNRHPRRVGMYELLYRRANAVTHHVDVMLLDNVPIAAQLSMHYGKTVFAMETCYDERHALLGPGNLMLFLAVARAIKLGATELGLHGHFDYYKHRWLGDTINTRDIRIQRKGSVPHLRASVGRLLLRLRGEAEKEVIPPAGPPSAGKLRPSPAPQCEEIVERVSKGAGAVRLDLARIQAMLPFSLGA